MARMAGAQWRPLPGTSTTRMASYDILCLHTMVGGLAGTDNYFRTSAAGTNSHFGVGADRTIYQWVDTTYRSGANLNGNYHIVSVETADTGAPFPAWGGSDVPAWTVEQVEALAQIAAWANATHGIPLELIPDAKPGRRGIGYHRQGVPGYMVAGAEKWSNSTGKVCPGDRRIAQIPQIIARAKLIRGGVAATVAPEEDMPTADELVTYEWYGKKFRGQLNYAQVIQAMDDNINALIKRVDGISTAPVAAAQPAVNVDAGAVAAALAGNQDFLSALARAVNDDAATRLAS